MDKFKSALSFEHFLVEHIHFKLNSDFEGDNFDSTPLSCRFTINHHFNEDDPNNILVSVQTQLYNEEFSQTSIPFYLDLKVNGFFKYHQSENEKPCDADKIVKANTVAILFPYVRSIITSITSQANVPPVILPPVNTFKMMEETNKDSEGTPQ